jgi:hypothetical protein
MPVQFVETVERGEAGMLAERRRRQEQIAHPRPRRADQRSGGTTSQPSRQPAMLKYLEKLLTTIASGSS